MADLPNQMIQVTTIAGGAGAAVRIQTFVGTFPNQMLVQDFELTGAQNTSFTAGMTATAGTTTSVQIPAAPAAIQGVYNWV